MDKDDLRYKAELCLIGGWAKRGIAEIKKGRMKSTKDMRRALNKLKKATHIEISKTMPVKGEVAMISNVIVKFTHDTGWWDQEQPNGAHVSFCKAIIAQSNRPFNNGIKKALDDIEKSCERNNDLKYDYFKSADIACQKWLSILGIHEEEERDSQEILRTIDAEIARENALMKYKRQFYPDGQ